MPDDLFQLDLADLISKIVRLALAFAIVFPVGLEREKAERTAGLRTFPLVSMASCGFVLVGTSFPGGGAEAWARVLEGVIAGMGFIGGGAILKDSRRVRGTATAASLWTAGAVGAACGFGQFTIAFLLGAINYLALRVSGPLKREIDHREPPRELDAGRGDALRTAGDDEAPRSTAPPREDERGERGA